MSADTDHGRFAAGIIFVPAGVIRLMIVTEPAGVFDTTEFVGVTVMAIGLKLREMLWLSVLEVAGGMMLETSLSIAA